MSAETIDGRAARPFSLDDWIVEPELNRVSNGEVSRFHARLECDSDRVAIEDLASKNGTLVNRTPITSRYELKPGDTIGIGLTTVTYRRLSDESTLTHD